MGALPDDVGGGGLVDDAAVHRIGLGISLGGLVVPAALRLDDEVLVEELARVTADEVVRVLLVRGHARRLGGVGEQQVGAVRRGPVERCGEAVVLVEEVGQLARQLVAVVVVVEIPARPGNLLGDGEPGVRIDERLARLVRVFLRRLVEAAGHLPVQHRGEADVEPELVLGDGAADLGAEVGGVAAVVEGVLAADGLAVAADLLAGGGEEAGGDVAEHRAVELVGARLGDHVDDAGGGAAVLGHEGAGLDVYLLHEVREDVGAEGAVGRVGHVLAVEDVAVLGRGGAVEADAVGVGLGARGDDGGGLEVAAHRDVGQELLGHDGAALGAAHVDDGGHAGLDDLLLELHRLGDHRHVGADGLVEPDADVGAVGRLVALELHRQLVLARRELGDAVAAAPVGDGGLLALKVGAGGDHQRASHRLAGGSVGDRADDGASSLCGDQAGCEQQRERGTPHEAHQLLPHEFLPDENAKQQPIRVSGFTRRRTKTQAKWAIST